jgi:hypothetical protein
VQIAYVHFAHSMESPAMRLPLALTALPLLFALAACDAPGGRPRSAAEGMAEPEMAPEVAAEPYSDLAPAPRAGRYQGVVRRGVVTAGDIDDALNLPAFLRYLGRAPGPKLSFARPVMAQLVGPDGAPAPGARYTLRKPGATEAFASGYAGPEGRIVVFPGLLGAGSPAKVELRVFGPDGQEAPAAVLAAGRAEVVRLPFASGWDPGFLDLVLVVDTTGSMGDEIAFLQREMIGIVRAAARAAPGLDIRFGLIAYRDRGDDYVVRNYGFAGSAGEMASWLRGLSADGGGDMPEAAGAAMAAAAGLDWRAGRGERLILQVADAPPQPGETGLYLASVRKAAARGVQVFTLGASGVDPAAETLMRQASAATGGRYVFLTDDSGVGYAHAEPTVSCYRVTKLSRLLVRILATELSGRRVEAGAGEVVREVGTYRGGLCRD